MIHLETITPDNWRFPLSVRDDQKEYVANPAVILARAYAYRDIGSQAYIIYNDETPIGMAMYYPCEELEAYEFSQFFIDQRYQGKGYGQKAAELILEKMKEDGKYNKVVLCYIEGDDAAKNLYEKLGFYHNGEVEEDEIIMEKAFDI